MFTRHLREPRTRPRNQPRSFGIDPFTVAAAVANVAAQAANVFGKKGGEQIGVKEQYMLSHIDAAGIGKNLLLALGYDKKTVNKLSISQKANIANAYNRFLSGDPLGLEMIRGILEAKGIDPSGIDQLRNLLTTTSGGMATPSPSAVPTTIRGVSPIQYQPSQYEPSYAYPLQQAGFSPLILILLGGGVLFYLLSD